jgi:hypothetical protein
MEPEGFISVYKNRQNSFSFVPLDRSTHRVDKVFLAELVDFAECGALY